jgi:tetratricopeptide (TPR) repeat protein
VIAVTRFFVVPVIAVAAMAQAKPTRADLRRAAREFTRGEKAFQLGDYKKALSSFEKAYALSEDPVVLLNVAQAARKLYDFDHDAGRLVRARELYRSFLREAPNSPERGKVEDLLRKVDEMIAAAQQPPREDALGAAQRLAEQKQYEQALAALDAALNQPNNSRETLIDIYKLRGILSARRGRDQEAQESFQHLLGVDPAHTLSETVDPPVMRAFAGARAYWSGKQPPRLDVMLPAQADEAKPLALDAKVPSDPLKMVARVDLLVRAQGQKDFVRYQGATVPETMLAPPGVEIVVLGVDAHGGAVCAEGTPQAPLRVAVGERAVAPPPVVVARTDADLGREPPPEPRPWYKRPLVLGAAGAAVAGGVVAAILLTRGAETADPCPECGGVRTGPIPAP